MVGVIFHATHATPEQYEQIRAALDTSENPPPGRLWHAAGIHDGVYVMEVWESEEAAQRFFDTHLAPAMTQAEMLAARTIFPIIGAIHP